MVELLTKFILIFVLYFQSSLIQNSYFKIIVDTIFISSNMVGLAHKNFETKIKVLLDTLNAYKNIITKISSPVITSTNI